MIDSIDNVRNEKRFEYVDKSLKMLKKADNIKFKTFDKYEDVYKWGEQFKEWENKLSSNQRDALKAYIDGNYDDINSFLRGKISNDLYFDYKLMRVLGNKCKYIHEALRGSIIPENVVVYRGATKSIFENKENPRLEDLIGTVIEDKGFVSTSMLPKSCWRTKEKPVIMTIKVPKGIKGAFIGPRLINNFKDEVELLLDKGQSMIVTNADYEGSQLMIDCEIIK
jgi:hypothetical protein